ncbi:MAG TPA: hypothetical protein VMT52_03860, partial [Planctomycetota bacterium]|nr:hypothetical protein [Planctomycetota bacterium]
MKPTVIMTVFLATSVVSLEVQEQVAAGNTDGKSCGDSNGDGKVDISDAIRMLMYIFNGGHPPVCP